MSPASDIRLFALLSLCGLVFLGLSLSGCGLFGPQSKSEPEYVGVWLQEDREIPAGRETIEIDFYLALTENRSVKWQVTTEGEVQCNTAGADILGYDGPTNKLTVAPDSGETRIKHYVEHLGDQIVYSERYIFYALGRSDTLNLTERNPSELEACRDQG